MQESEKFARGSTDIAQVQQTTEQTEQSEQNF
jgi:hypothetical protein